MASRRDLKKKITYVAGNLFMASLIEGVDREAVVDSVRRVLELVPRVSHTEPGNVKGYYRKLKEDLDQEVALVAQELDKAIAKEN